MLEMNDRRRLMWTGAALIGAVCLGTSALAGNYAAVVPTNSGIEYYSVEMHLGDRLKTTTTDAQLLVDDITYAVEVVPDHSNIPTAVPLWLTPEFLASYETTGGVITNNSNVGNALYSTAYSPTTGTLPSGRTITFDTETWSVARFEYFAVEMQEVNGSNEFQRAFDETTQEFHGSMYARLEHIPGGGRGDALGLGVSESMATLSESRHYQTPHIVPYGNEVRCQSVGTGTYTSVQVYVKGRVVVDGADALTENAGIVVHY
jgi:hypothetical protein